MKNKQTEKNITQRSPGFWILISFGILLNIFYLLGQTMALISYDFAVSIGLQEPMELVTAIGVAVNKGFGLGDTFLYMPLFILGILGLFKRASWGYYAMSAAMGITVYWPLVSLSTLYFAKGAEGWAFTNYTSYSFVLGFIALYGLWGLYFLYTERHTLGSKHT